MGAFIVTIGNEWLREVGQYRLLLLGLAVVLIILFMPKGIVALPDQFQRFKLKRFSVSSRKSQE